MAYQYPASGISVLQYGADPTGVADSEPAFALAIAALPLSGVNDLNIPAGTYKIGSNLLVPVTVRLVFAGHAALSIADGVAVAINGSVVAPDKSNIFQYANITTQPVVFSAASVQPYISVYWFGAAGDGSTDEYAALQAAVRAFPQQVYFPPGSFQIRSLPVLFGSSTSVHIFGAGYESKILCNQDAAPAWPPNGGASGVDAYGLLVFKGATQTTTNNNIEVDHLCFIGNTIAPNNTGTTDSTCNPNMLMFLNWNSKVNIHDNYFENGQNNVIWQGGNSAGTPELPPGNLQGDILENCIFSNNHITNWGWNTAYGVGTTIAAGSNGVNVNTFAGSGVVYVASTTGFPSTGTIGVATGSGVEVVTYTGLSGGNSFTGCTCTTAGVMATGGNVCGGNAALYGFNLGAPCVQLTARCVTVQGNTFYQVANGMNISGKKVTVAGNTIREFVLGAIILGDEWDADTIAVTGNVIETRMHTPLISNVYGLSLGSPIGIRATDVLSGPMADGVSIVGNTIRFESNAQAPWLTGTVYSFDYNPVFTSNGGNVYKLYSAGTSSGAGPSGTSTVTPTGTGATWLYVEPLVTGATPTGIQLNDCNAVCSANAVSYLLGNSQTGSAIGITVAADAYSANYVLSANIVRFLGLAASFADCTGIQAAGAGSGFLNTVMCHGNLVTGLGTNPPNASGVVQTPGVAFAFTAPTPPDTLLAYLHGDISDGGQVDLGGSSVNNYNAPIYAGVDTRSAAYPVGVATAFLAGPNTLVFSVGNRVYQCITSGTTAGGSAPTSTAADITDGSVHWKYIGIVNASLWAPPITLQALPSADSTDTATFLVSDHETQAMRKGYAVSTLYTLFHDILGGNSYKGGTSGSPLQEVNVGGNITSGIGAAGQDQIKVGGQLRANFTGGVVDATASQWAAGGGSVAVATVTGGDPAHFIDIQANGGTPTQIDAGTAICEIQLNQAYSATANFVTIVQPRNATTAAVGSFYAIGSTTSKYKLYCSANFTPAAATLYEWGVLQIGTS